MLNLSRWESNDVILLVGRFVQLLLVLGDEYSSDMSRLGGTRMKDVTRLGGTRMKDVTRLGGTRMNVKDVTRLLGTRMNVKRMYGSMWMNKVTRRDGNTGRNTSTCTRGGASTRWIGDYVDGGGRGRSLKLLQLKITSMLPCQLVLLKHGLGLPSVQTVNNDLQYFS